MIDFVLFFLFHIIARERAQKNPDDPTGCQGYILCKELIIPLLPLLFQQLLLFLLLLHLLNQDQPHHEPF